MVLLIVIGCFAFAFLVEHVYYSYLDTLPKDKRDELIKKQSQKGFYGEGDFFTMKGVVEEFFEAVGMKRGKLLFQCKRCKRIC